MTKEQEVIKRLNFHKEYARLSSNRVVISETDLETVLSMLKENSAEIEKKNTELAEKNAEIEKLKKVLDEKYIFVQGARTVYGRLMSLDKEDIVKDDLALRNEIYHHIEDKEKKDKIIDLMAEQLAGLTIWNNEKEEPLILADKEEVIKYFEKKRQNVAERKSEEWKLK